MALNFLSYLVKGTLCNHLYMKEVDDFVTTFFMKVWKDVEFELIVL